MRRKLFATIAFVALALVLIFVPVVPETYVLDCYGPGCSGSLSYTASVTYHIFFAGAVSGVCGGYQVVIHEIPSGFSGVMTGPGQGEAKCVTLRSPP